MREVGCMNVVLTRDVCEREADFSFYVETNQSDFSLAVT